MNIVIYARFSSHSQNEQSIEGQLRTCYEFAERNGYVIIGEYIDRAISGKDAENRPQFQKMIADSAKRQFSAILVYQLDRFARNRYDSATYKNKLKKNNVRVLSAKENITDDASGILVEGLLESMAEYYSVELSQKIRRGMNLNAEKCLCTGGGLALGYQVNENKMFEINEEEAHIVRQIFTMYISGKTMAEIIRYLNDNGIKTSRGNEYNKNSIRRILTNRRYVGVYTYNGTEVPDGIPRIVDDETFQQAVYQLEKNKKAPARAKAVGENYILTTKLFCGYCGAAITGISGTAQSGKIHQYYQCVTNRRKGDCKKKTIKKHLIEEIVAKEIVGILNSDRLNAIIKNVLAYSEKESNTDAIKYLRKQLRENESATANLIAALESGKAVDIIAAQIEKRQAEKTGLELQLAKEQMMSQSLTYEQVDYFLRKFKCGDTSDIQYRQSLVDMFVSKMLLFDDKLVILCNISEHKIEIPLDELLGSSKGRLVEATGVEPVSEKLFMAVSTSVFYLQNFLEYKPINRPQSQ